MNVFKEEVEIKRVIFNVNLELAERLETAKKDARIIGKKLDFDGAINKSLEKFLKKAEKRIADVKKKKGLSSDPEPAEESAKVKDNGDKADGNDPSKEGDEQKQL